MRGLTTVLVGALTRNAEQVLTGAEQMGFVAPGGDRELLREVGRRYLEALASVRISDFSSFDREEMQKLSGYAHVRGRLREVMRSVEYPEGYFYLERTLALLFGPPPLFFPGTGFDFRSLAFFFFFRSRPRFGGRSFPFFRFAREAGQLFVVQRCYRCPHLIRVYVRLFQRRRGSRIGEHALDIHQVSGAVL